MKQANPVRLPVSNSSLGIQAGGLVSECPLGVALGVPGFARGGGRGVPMAVLIFGLPQ